MSRERSPSAVRVNSATIIRPPKTTTSSAATPNGSSLAFSMKRRYMLLSVLDGLGGEAVQLLGLTLVEQPLGRGGEREGRDQGQEPLAHRPVVVAVALGLAVLGVGLGVIVGLRLTGSWGIG